MAQDTERADLIKAVMQILRDKLRIVLDNDSDYYGGVDVIAKLYLDDELISSDYTSAGRG